MPACQLGIKVRTDQIEGEEGGDIGARFPRHLKSAYA